MAYRITWLPMTLSKFEGYKSVQQCVSIIKQWITASWLRLNMDKTVLMWISTKYVSVIPVSCRSLTLGGGRFWCCTCPQFCWSRTYHLTSMSLWSVQSASSSSDYCASSDVHSTAIQQLHLFMRSLPAGSTTAEDCWLARWRRWLTSCSMSSMLRKELYPTPASTIEGWVSSGETTFIGWTSTIELSSECVSRFSSVCTAWRLRALV